jgi:hypothetical protein
MNACIAWAGSDPVVLVEEPEDEELLDEDPDVALALEVVSPVAPICDSACMMESIRPPPGGGGGGGTSELASEELVTSDCVLVVVLLLLASCASQLLRLETLPIVMSVSVAVKLKVNTT